MSRWPAGVDLIELDQIDSTNAEAARRADTVFRPTWILAHNQIAPKGRRGRPWQMPKGNFAATLILPRTTEPGDAALRSFVAALALHQAFAQVTGRAGAFALKWPNDVLLNGGKLAGILLELLQRPGQTMRLLIGIGINLEQAPPAEMLEQRATEPVSIKGALGLSISPNEMLDHLAGAFDEWESRLTQFGFEPIREAWLARAARLGETVTARLTNEEFTGRFETVDKTGALVLVTPKGRRAIPAADIYF